MNASKGRKCWSDEKLLSRALSVRTDRAYWDSVNELRGRASDSLYEKCMALTKSGNPKERRVGTDVLSEFYRKDKKKKYGFYFPYDKKINKYFYEMINIEDNLTVIPSILHGIGHSNKHVKSKNINSILEFIDSDNDDIRFSAISALSGIEDMKAIRGLIKLSKDRRSFIRDWATFAIGGLSDLDNDEIRKALYERCADRHYGARMEAISGLAKRKDHGVKKYLEKEFDDAAVYVLEAIRDLDAKEYLPRLEAMLEDAEKIPSDDSNQYWLGHLKECVEKLRSCGKGG